MIEYYKMQFHDAAKTYLTAKKPESDQANELMDKIQAKIAKLIPEQDAREICDELFDQITDEICDLADVRGEILAFFEGLNAPDVKQLTKNGFRYSFQAGLDHYSYNRLTKKLTRIDEIA